VKLPDLSYMMTVAALRYIQSIYEPPERRNPDGLVRELLTPWQRIRCHLRASTSIGALRAQPFYYYVLSRTRYYDEVHRHAVADGITQIVNIGAGSDTRAYRFADQLQTSHVRVLECDQPKATQVKQLVARRRWRADHVSYLPIDLNEPPWQALEHWLQQHCRTKTLVLMEGVSPYVDSDCFARFLGFLAAALPRGSSLAYDFKLPGVNEAFGRSRRTPAPFRLASARDEVAAFHSNRGYRLNYLETSADLSRRLLPALDSLNSPLFDEDVLVQLEIAP
jgi:methyltransferase (TIGR00027 family)